MVETKHGPIFYICLDCIDNFANWILNENYYLIEGEGDIIQFTIQNKIFKLPNDKRVIKGFSNKFKEFLDKYGIIHQ